MAPQSQEYQGSWQKLTYQGSWQTAGAAVELSGSINAVSSTSASLTLECFLSGSIDTVVTTAAGLVVTYSLSGTIAGIATTSAILSLTQALSGSIDAISSLIGILTTNLKALSGTIAIVSNLSSSFLVTKFMRGQIPAISIVTGLLKTSGSLAGRISMVSNIPSAELVVIEYSGNLFETGSCINVYSDANPIFAFPPNYFRGDLGDTKDLQLWIKNDGDLLLTSVSITPIDLVGSGQETWIKLATSQVGLDSAIAGAALDLPNLSVDEITSFWVRATVVIDTPEEYVRLALKIDALWAYYIHKLLQRETIYIGDEATPIFTNPASPSVLDLSPSSLDFGAGLVTEEITVSNTGGSTLTWEVVCPLELDDVVADGSTTITSVTGGFTPQMVGRIITIVGRDDFEIITYTNTNTVIVDAAVAPGTGLTSTVETWITPDIPSGTIQPGNSTIVTFTVNRTSLLPGDYEEVLEFTSNDGDTDIPVDMEVAGAGVPVLGLYPTSGSTIDYGPNLLQRTITVTNLGTGTLNWSVNTPDWLSPSQGSGALGASQYTIVTFSVNKSGLVANCYAGTAAFTSNGGNGGVFMKMRVSGHIMIRLPHVLSNDVEPAPCYTCGIAEQGGRFEIDADLVGDGGHFDVEDALTLIPLSTPEAGSRFLDSSSDIFSESMVEQTIFISGGTGFVSGTYTITSYDRPDRVRLDRTPSPDDPGVNGQAIIALRMSWSFYIRGCTGDIGDEITIDLSAAASDPWLYYSYWQPGPDCYSVMPHGTDIPAIYDWSKEGWRFYSRQQMGVFQVPIGGGGGTPANPVLLWYAQPIGYNVSFCTNNQSQAQWFSFENNWHSQRYEVVIKKTSLDTWTLVSGSNWQV